MSKTADSVPLDYVPQDADDLVRCLRDPMWRVCSGHLYKIIAKDDSTATGTKVIPFVPNEAQMRLIRRLHYRNLILKARQLGFTTLACVLWLDHALFNSNQRCGIIAHDRESAEAIFRDKVKFAYDNLPESLRRAMPLAKDSAIELLFAHNNSSVRVATSMRSGTIDRLLVSEFGKICRRYPQKASEIVTGSLPAVPLRGIAVIESTSEGQGGEFHDMVRVAETLQDLGRSLTEREWRLHFYAWWMAPDYRMDPAGVVITPKDHEYFDQVEAKADTRIDLGQRAWYVATRNADFAGDPQKMWQEYPSTPAEAFQQSTEGAYYAIQLAQARKDGRIGRVPHVSHAPVNTFWDIGASDGTAIWLHQHVGAEDRFVGFLENWVEPYSYYVRELQNLGYVWGTHYLPHDAGHKRQMGDRVASPKEMLEELAPGWRFEIVPRVDELMHGIQLTRERFGSYWFDEERCKAGLDHLGAYRKEWDARLGVWRDGTHSKEGGHTEAADALRQHAQGFRSYAVTSGTRPTRRRSGAMAV